MDTINSIYDKLMALDWFQFFVSVIFDLDSTRLWAIIALTAILAAFLIYKKTGKGGLVALLLMYFIAYILFQYDLINFYEERTIIREEHIKII